MPKEEKAHENEFEELYFKERKKSSLLLIVAVVFAISAVGSIAWAVSKQSGPGGQQPGEFSGNFDGQGRMGGGPGMMDITSFFKDDGSVDTDAIDEMTSRFPSGADSRFVERIKDQADQAVEDGDITQDQADALIKAIEADTDSSNDG